MFIKGKTLYLWWQPLFRGCGKGKTLYLWWQPLFRGVSRGKHYIYGGNHCLGVWQGENTIFMVATIV